MNRERHHYAGRWGQNQGDRKFFNNNERRLSVPAFENDKILNFYKYSLNDHHARSNGTWCGQIIRDSFDRFELFTPPGIRDSRKIEKTDLRTALQNLARHMDLDWISDDFSEFLRKSALLWVKLKPLADQKLNIEYRLRLSVEALREYHAQYESLRDLGYLGERLCFSKVPTVRRFSKDKTTATSDLRATVERYTTGIIIPQEANSTKYLLDFNYMKDFLYFYKAHHEWNQIFVPERVFEENPCVYRLVLLVSQEFSLYSSSEKLYLEIRNYDNFLVGDTTRLCMTCDKSRASQFVIKDRTNGVSLNFQDMKNTTRYDLYLYDPSSICSYPMFLSFSGFIAQQTQVKNNESLMGLIKHYRVSVDMDSSTATAAATAVTTVADAVDCDPDKSSNSNVLRDISNKVSQERNLEATPLDSCFFVSDQVIYHPSAPLVGFRNMSVATALDMVFSLYNFVVASRQSSDPGKVSFSILLRHGHEGNGGFNYGIGCNPKTKIPTSLNKSLVNLTEESERRAWESVTLEVELDFLSYLRVRETSEHRYQWLTRVFSLALSPEALRDNSDYQRFKTAEVFSHIKGILHSLDSSSSPTVHSWTILQHIEYQLLQRYDISNFDSLYLSQRSLLDFLVTRERQCKRLLSDHINTTSSSWHKHVESVGYRFSTSSEMHDSEDLYRAIVVENVLRFFNVATVTMLGYPNKAVLWESIRQRDEIIHEETTSEDRSDEIVPLRCVTNIESLSLGNGYSRFPIPVRVEVMAQAAVTQSRVLDNMFETTKWKLLFEAHIGSMSQYLTSDTTLRFVEVADNVILRLPDASGDAMSEYRTIVGSMFSRSHSMSHSGSNATNNTDNLAFQNEQELRHFLGALIGLWACGDSEFSMISLVVQALRTMLTMIKGHRRVSTGRMEAEACSAVFNTVLCCLNLVPTSIVQDIGKSLLLAVAEILDAEHRQALLANFQHSYHLDVSATVVERQEVTLSVGARLLMLQLAATHHLEMHSYLQQLFGLVPVSATAVSATSLQLSDIVTGTGVQTSASVVDDWASFEDSLLNISAVEEEKVHVGDELSNIAQMVQRHEELTAFISSLARDSSLAWDSDKQEYVALSDSKRMHTISHNAVMVIAQQLYSHQGRSIFELLQNADDCEYSFFDDNARVGRPPSLHIELTKQRLLLSYNEKGFDIAHVDAVSAINASTKLKTLDQGGKKGIGFKSVFMISENPEVHSKGFHFKFREQGLMGYLTPIQINKADVSADIERLSMQGTVLQLPLRTTNIVVPGSSDHYAAIGGVQQEKTEESREKLHRMLQEQLREMQPKMMLFLRRLRKIQVRHQCEEMEGCVTFERVDRGFMRYIRKIDNHDGSVVQLHSWVLGCEERAVANDYLVPGNPVQVAIPLRSFNSSNQMYSEVYSLLPIRSYGLPFALNGPFQVTASREDLVKPGSSQMNDKLLSCVPAVFMAAVTNTLSYGRERYQSDSSVAGTRVLSDCCSAVLRAVPLLNIVEPQFKDTVKLILSRISETPCIPTTVSSDCLSDCANSVHLVSPLMAVLLPIDVEWRQFQMSDLSCVLSAGLGLTLVDPSTVSTEFSITSIPTWTALTRALKIRQLDKLMLQEAFISMWNTAILNSINNNETQFTRLVSSGVLKRLLDGMFRMAMMNTTTSNTATAQHNEVSTLTNNLRDRLLVRIVVAEVGATAISYQILTLRDCCNASSTVSYIPTDLWQSTVKWGTCSLVCGAHDSHAQQSMMIVLQQLYLQWISSVKVMISPSTTMGIVDPQVSVVVEEKLLIDYVPTLPSAKSLSLFFASSDFTQQQVEFVALLCAWLTESNRSASSSAAADSTGGLVDQDKVVNSTRMLMTQMHQLLWNDRATLRRLHQTILNHFPVAASNNDISEEAVADETSMMKFAVEREVQCLWRLLRDQLQYPEQQRLTAAASDQDDDDIDHNLTEEDDQQGMLHGAEEEESSEFVDVSLVARFNRTYNQHDRHSLIKRILVGRIGEAFMFHTLQGLFPASEGYSVIWVNEVQETGKPFDIVIKRRDIATNETTLMVDEEVAVVEVKATGNKKKTSSGSAAGVNNELNSQIFEVSVNELAAMHQRPDKYWLARVYGVRIESDEVDSIAAAVTNTVDRGDEATVVTAVMMAATASVVSTFLSSLRERNEQRNHSIRDNRHSNDRLDYDLIREAFHALNEHRWQLLCAMYSS